MAPRAIAGTLTRVAGVDWGLIASIGAGALAAIAGGYLEGRTSAGRSAKLAGKVAREVRRAEREEEALLEVRTQLVEVDRWLRRAVSVARAEPDRFRAHSFPLDEELGKLRKLWTSQASLRVHDAAVLAAMQELDPGARENEWAGAPAAADALVIAERIAAGLERVRVAIEAVALG